METVPTRACVDCGALLTSHGDAIRCRSCATRRWHKKRRGGGPLRGSITRKGYRRVKINGRQVMEHRWVMEQHLGRKLDPKEVVHHKNGDRLDNRIENLELHSTHSEHLREHQGPAEWLCLWCGGRFQAKPCIGRKFCSRLCYNEAHRGVAPTRGLSLGDPIPATP